MLNLLDMQDCILWLLARLFSVAAFSQKMQRVILDYEKRIIYCHLGLFPRWHNVKLLPGKVLIFLQQFITLRY